MKCVALRSSLVPMLFAFCACQSASIAPETAGTTEAKAEKSGADKKALAKARKEQKRAHDLECAKKELAVAELEVQASTREATDELDDAKRDTDEAKRALELFKTRSLPQELADGRLGLDRAMQRKVEAEQELREMEKTYAKDEFATDTKELVLTRHRKSLEFATRALELEEQQYADLEREKLPLEQRELEQKLREAERKLREAEAEMNKVELENQVKLAKARFEVSELEQPIDDDDEDEGEGKKGKGGKS